MIDPPAEPLDLLCIAPHPDDAEISIGGSLAVALADGLRVGVLELTDGEPTPHGSREKRRAETDAATKVLGLSWRGNLGLMNRSLEHTLETRRAVAGAIRQLRPRTLLAPFAEDAHPDHVAAAELVDAARFWAKLSKSDLPGEPHHPRHVFAYYSIHLRIIPDPAFVIDISDQIETKMAAVRCYESQLITGRPTEFPTLLDNIRDRSRYWGWSIGTAYGEPFASREPVGLGGFPD